MSFYQLPLIFALTTTSALAADAIVRLKPTQQKSALKSLNSQGLVIKEALIPEMNIYLVHSADKSIDNKTLANKLRTQAGIIRSMPDSPVTMRVAPQDPQYSNQYGPVKIGAPAAWDLGTGGVTADGDEVVIAVVDNGVDIAHEDLANNLWSNRSEIPGNGIDDDGNGYVDDVNGWNAYNDNATIPAGYHGTHVAGIVGAEGGNRKHVAGINWNVKIMSVAASSGTTSVVLKGYGYVLKQKQLWLQTNGAKGANVVATNSSFGVDAADCTKGEFILWNDIYNEMGRAGILSAAATANRAWDIDQVGDVPTGCNSEFIVSVTNTTRNDRIYDSAGWGATTIDLAAPGTDVLSTVPGNRTVEMTGTSMATPHVSGSIALLHSIGSQRFAQLAKSNPAQAARDLKAIIMRTVDPLSDLRGKTVSGGRLNLQKSAEAISQY